MGREDSHDAGPGRIRASSIMSVLSVVARLSNLQGSRSAYDALSTLSLHAIELPLAHQYVVYSSAHVHIVEWPRICPVCLGL